MTSFTQTFSGSAVSPSDVAYAAYSFGTNLTLYWPAFSYGQTDVAARFMNLTATANSLNVFMPDATLVSVGYDVIIFNAGADTFNVVNSTGGAIATIAAGQTYYLILNNNTTQAGTWQTVQFGVGTGSASAAALAGAGLLAAAGMLNVNLDATTISGSTNITSSARAILQVWVGGSGTLTLPAAGSVGDGFFFPLANNGGGSVTIATSGGDQIDGASSSVFAQTQSAFIVSSGSAWYTVGKGIQNTFAVTLLNLNVAGSSDIVETSAQAQNIIQQYTGVLTGNINVIVPATVQLYYVFNNTSGSFSLTVKTAAGTGIIVPQGAHSILYCDGTNVLNAFTSTFGGAISISPGSASAPNLNFIGSSTTGIYSPSTNQIALTAGGFEVMNFLSASSSVNYLQSQASAAGNPVSISALGGDTNISITLSPKGTGSINIAKAVITGGSVDGAIIGATTPAAITGTTITGTTLVSTIATGTAPLTVASTTQVVNLMASTVATNANLTGPVTSVGNATSVTANAITNTMLAQMPTLTIKGNNTGGTANALDLTISQVNTMLGGNSVKTVKSQQFTSSGTYTPFTGMLYCIVEAVGSGGSGGGGGSSGGGSGAGGGGAGEYCKQIFSAATIGASQTFTIGAATTGGTTGNNGSSGNTTSFGALISCAGGSGGNTGTSASAPGGLGGTSGAFSSGYVPGQPGGTGINGAAPLGGNGGSGIYGAGGLGASSINFSAGGGFGRGTGGGGGTGSGSGGSGSPGYIIITEFCSQ